MELSKVTPNVLDTFQVGDKKPTKFRAGTRALQRGTTAGKPFRSTLVWSLLIFKRLAESHSAMMRMRMKEQEQLI